ncbi:hypothetical protein Taro_029402 [Colocasia esculenta]|uniref:C3H1-type domain-containing protein n=1 Tax=Colocasia esculenta TaxID=4460 RepID=A0A843VIV4_COLES|nr:hypothetical protein [Colocasia esculenta]
MAASQDGVPLRAPGREGAAARPRKFLYHGIACPGFRSAGECIRGQHCEFAHGVFEFWLHPSRYRTRPCKAGEHCRRKMGGGDDDDAQRKGGGKTSDLPDIDWICELLASEILVSAMAPQFASPGGDGRQPHESDEFRMYSFKVKRCSKTRSHDWTECPYAHRGEKARRRDPRKFLYHGIACPEFRSAGECIRGQHCEFAHGVFEFWLHPSRYRTRPCKAGEHCRRKVCFFAHTPEQLRAEDCHVCRLACRLGGGCDSPAEARSTEPPPLSSFDRDPTYKDLSECMRRLEMGGGGGDDDAQRKGGGETSDLPDIDWICELVK